MMKLRQLVVFAAFTVSSMITAQDKALPQYDVTWNELGTDENCSMPLGNGDIAVNAWTEQNGDLVMLVAKTDAWSENAQLLKLGRVRLSLTPNPFAGRKDFAQTLTIRNGLLTLRSGRNEVRMWVDANNPVIRVAADTENKTKLTVKNELWRNRNYHLTQEQVNENVFNYWEWRSNPGGLDFLADIVLPQSDNRTGWCHFNSHSMYNVVLEREHLGNLVGKYADPLLHRCFGCVAEGRGLTAADNRTLLSAKAAKHHEVNIYALTEQADNVEKWQSDINAVIDRGAKTSHAEAWHKHEQWWTDFWNRSYINVSGTQDADNVYKGYTMNRYMTACAGRGKYPIKFNGSIFTVGHDMPEGKVSMADDHDPDFRDWGSCLWHQNIRHIYYPLVAAGDYDMLMPWLDTYTNALPLAKDKVRQYYGHDGAAFIETMHFWGLPNLNDFGWDNPGNDPQSGYMTWHVQGALEIIVNMLDYYDNTQDTIYLKEKLLPFAEAIVTYYNEHWKRGEDGKILFDPHQSIEMYQKGVVNPTPDIAGLMCITERLLNVEHNMQTQKLLELWKTVRRDLPEIPVGRTQDGKLPLRANAGDADGKPVILPAQVYGDPSNGENPELYTVFPYRNYCLGKPDIELALNTFEARRYPFDNCWGQDGMEAALLGLTDVAKKAAVHAMTTYGKQKFPWFWAKVADYSPDMDNGGTGMMTLQLMMMQANGREIRLVPAWPEDWNADFRLNAPYNTQVEGRVENGKIVNLKVTPENRRKDIIIE